MRRYGILALLLLAVTGGMAGCAGRKVQESEWQKVEFTVMETQELPDELLEIIEENKEGEIRMAYEDGSDLYLIRGYGMQKSGGYSIAVKECAENETTLRLDTQLIGPPDSRELPRDPSSPYLVIKMKLREKDVEME